jgi:hypothetical protein
MSYDFMIFRAPVELKSLEDIESAATLTPGDWRSDAQHLLASVIPGLQWSTRGDWCSASHPDNSVGRFSLAAHYSDNVTVLHVSGSHRADQLHLVQACAQAIGGYAFDMQSCSRVWPATNGV